MSEKSSEYLKRTCLICGCHTDQTINIYEPRSGPNIVELIQAKFKIQPLNEEKYLCFSCNNWLINWHSLQSLNSNDADSPSGTFRPQMNDMLYKEKAENQRQQTKFPYCEQPNLQHHRPTARVNPLCITTETHTPIASSHKHSKPEAVKEYTSFWGNGKSIPKYQCRYHRRTFRYVKRRIIVRNFRIRRQSIKYKSTVGCTCILSIKLTNSNYIISLPSIKNVKARRIKKLNDSCIKKPRGYKNEKKPKQKEKVSQKNISETYTRTNASNDNFISIFEDSRDTTNNHNQCLQRPLVDGKVVSMLRRLGTTLSHENLYDNTKAGKHLFPPIMSPTKSKPRGIRQLGDNEILLDFNLAISEVLPQVIRNQKQKPQYQEELLVSLHAKQSLAYQVSIDKDIGQYPLLPDGLSISLI